MKEIYAINSEWEQTDAQSGGCASEREIAA